MTGTQTTFPFPPETKPVPTIADRFAAFDRDNPHVFRELLRRARAALDSGAVYIGVKAIVEDMRCDPELITSGLDYKMNNTYTALYARKLIEAEPRLCGIVRVRG